MADQISGDVINGGTGSITISQLAGAIDCNSQAMTNAYAISELQMVPIAAVILQ